jgi:hypothetical protein
MVIRLLRPLLAILVAVALFGAPAVQAAAVRCDTMHMATAGKAFSGGTQAPTPCKMMPDCTDALGCASVSLPVSAISVVGPLTWPPALVGTTIGGCTA